MPSAPSCGPWADPRSPPDFGANYFSHSEATGSRPGNRTPNGGSGLCAETGERGAQALGGGGGAHAPPEQVAAVDEHGRHARHRVLDLEEVPFREGIRLARQHDEV